MANCKQDVVSALNEFSQTKKEFDHIIFQEKKLPRLMRYKLKDKVSKVDCGVERLTMLMHK